MFIQYTKYSIQDTTDTQKEYLYQLYLKLHGPANCCIKLWCKTCGWAIGT